eukprot:TRINITY_DN47_c0_g1_i6.p2 TRINITY_DN47_c0_g1~~TRINITY_DN47_c0_g1_i6.p2  ORF type:complete len:392 (-),score=135.85 TRINITY_DN47_c0_g1_i6:1317-2492(-)
MCIRDRVSTQSTWDIKEKMIEHNRRPHSTLVHLDDILMDLKLDPRVLEVPVPRWLRDEEPPSEALKVLNLEQKAEEKKKKKKKKGKKKGGKKKKKEGEEPKIPQTIGEKEAWYDKIISENNIQEEEEVVEPFAYEIDIVMAIRQIQKNERGRQWRTRLLKIIAITRKIFKDNEKKKRIKEGLELATDEEKEKKATLLTQKRLRGLLDRRKVNEMRQQELYFLGMSQKPKTEEEQKNSSSIKVKEIEQMRKKIQKEIQEEYRNAIMSAKEEVKMNEEFDIKDRMYDERMLWIIDYRRDHAGKLPKGAEQFYKRENVEKPKTEAELAEEEAKAAAKKKGKGKGEKKPKEKKAKKKGEKKEPKKELLWTGPTTDVVMQLQEKTENYINVWEKKR